MTVEGYRTDFAQITGVKLNAPTLTNLPLPHIEFRIVDMLEMVTDIEKIQKNARIKRLTSKLNTSSKGLVTCRNEFALIVPFSSHCGDRRGLLKNCVVFPSA